MGKALRPGAGVSAGVAQEPLAFTGEQVVPGTTPDRIWQDHMKRYEWAAPLVRGQVVLDVACGTGYGAAYLAKSGAAMVEGVDIAPEVVAEANRVYASGTANLRFREGRIEELPFPDGHFGAVTCFETIEHVPDPVPALAELRRVLRPGGTLLLSTPNRRVTSPLKARHEPPNNKHHVQEFLAPEIEGLMAPHFAVEERLGQRLRPRLLFVPAVYRRWHRRRKAWYRPELGDPAPRRFGRLADPRYLVYRTTRRGD